MGCGGSSRTSRAPPASRQLYTPPPDIGELIHMVVNRCQIEAPLGFVLFVDNEDEFTRIVEVKDYGLVSDWNAKHPAEALRKGDHILSVNGIGGLGELGYTGILTELRAFGEKHVIVKRGEWVKALPTIKAICCRSADCCVCQKSLDMDVDVIELPCGHGVHVQCALRHIPACTSLDEVVCPRCWDFTSDGNLPDSGIDATKPSEPRSDLLKELTQEANNKGNLTGTCSSKGALGLLMERTTQSLKSFISNNIGFTRLTSQMEEQEL